MVDKQRGQSRMESGTCNTSSALSARRKKEKSTTHTVDILSQGPKVFLPPGQLCQGIMCWVRLGLQGHMAAIAIELPHEARITGKR